MVSWFRKIRKRDTYGNVEMHEKTRYSIRLAGKKEITTEIITEDFEKYFEVFYKLMTETAKRNGFSLHQKNYYKNIFESLSKINSYLSIAKYKEKILCIYQVVIYGEVANYIYGSSSNEERNRNATYATHWEAIKYAKQLNCNYYNFGGIEKDNLLNKGMVTLTLYKKKFGGKEIAHSDFFDVVVSSFWYRLYNFRKLIKKIK
ncbi:peptidoglycan bridge formation glycyltransferase FemA/FemB family protein [Patescibacteria group bacterium]|nr:peptidoglycan bridge formation glycyltransferase FemA/FemB family protein [Patescibacteria group bacterium]